MGTVGDIMSTAENVQYTGGYHDECRRYHEYTGDVQYTGRCSVHWGMLSTLGDVQYTGGCSVHWGMFSTLEFPYKFNCFPNDLPHIYHDITPVYS